MTGSLKQLLKLALRRHSPQLRARARTIKRFASKVGLVYFGTVDQHVDDHDVIRGLTVSTTHQDTHYAVGSYDGADISIVDRFDVLVDHQGHQTEHSWLIMRIDLEVPESLPHIFLHPLGHGQEAYDKFFRAYANLQPANSMLLGAHSPEFHNRYGLYAIPTQALAIERLFTPQVTQTIAARLWPHAIEILDNKLYIYTTEPRLSEQLLETALETSLWLARIVDESDQQD